MHIIRGACAHLSSLTTAVRPGHSLIARRRWWLLLPLLLGWQAPVPGQDVLTNGAQGEGSRAQQSRVSVPVRLDYPLLQQLLAAQLLTGPDQSRELLEDPGGCSEIVLSEPQLAPRNRQLEVLAAVRARMGLGESGACTTLLTWQGRIRVTGTPELRNSGTALGFVPDTVLLLDPQGQPLASGGLQQMVDSSARTFLSDFTVNLAPQLESVAALLPEVLPRHSRQQIAALVAGLHLSDLRVGEDTLDVDIVFDVEPADEAPRPEHALSEEELARWEERWQMMDALLVLVVKHYAAATQLQELREALLDALIESRYRLRDALVEPPGAGEDLVRTWFLQSWETLAPILRRIGLEQAGEEHLLWLSVVSATDALTALDRLGPGVGLDISTDGLRRLARMINGGAGKELLRYSDEVDPALRRLLEEHLESTAPASTWRLEFSLFPRAVAADTGRLNRWSPKPEELADYLPQLAALLHTSATTALARRNLEPAQEQLFRRLVLATAWQESCWRQYVVSDERKLVPLRSGTGDVGLMQMNERVWRGFYDQQQLRWDIAYNGAAGAEVLLDYLVKQAIRKGEHKQPGGLSNLARSAYSAYNGGPSQFSRYRSKSASAYGKKVDAAFWDKYQQVAAGNEMSVSRCLGGRLDGPAPVSVAARPSPGGSTGGGDWLAAQPANHFTVQLGAFSTDEAAQAFIKQNALTGKARAQRRRKGDTGQFLVLYGSYATRAQADKASQGLARLKPWVRQFDAL